MLWFVGQDGEEGDIDFTNGFKSIFIGYALSKVHKTQLVDIFHSFASILPDKRPVIDYAYFIDILLSVEEGIFFPGEEEKLLGYARRSIQLKLGVRLATRFAQWTCFGGMVPKPHEALPLYYKTPPTITDLDDALEDAFAISITGVETYMDTHGNSEDD